MARPSRTAEIEQVRRIAGPGVTAASIRSFFSRPERLSADLRQRIATAVAEVGYRPRHPTRGGLDSVRIGIEIPRAYTPTGPSPIMSSQLVELILAAQRRGATLVPFVVDPVVPGVDDVAGGTEAERRVPQLGLYAWQRTYAKTLAPREYAAVMRRSRVRAFIVNDLIVDDARLQTLNDNGVAYVALGAPMRTLPDGSVGADTRHSYVEDDVDAGIAAMVHALRDAGAMRFAHLGFAPDDSVVPHARVSAVTAVVGSVPHHEVHYELIQQDHSRSVATVRDWLRAEELGSVDALICDSDSLADLVRTAAPQAGRHVVRDPRERAADRPDLTPLAVCGNDAAQVRTTGDRDERTWWMTMHADGDAVADAAMDVLAARIDAGDGPAIAQLVPPIMIGMLGGPPDHRAPLRATGS